MDSVHNMRYYAVTSITQWQNHASGTMAKPKSLYMTAPEPTSGTMAKPRSLYTYLCTRTHKWDNGKTAQVGQ